MANGLSLECQACGFVGLDDGSDGFYYCQRCGTRADGIRDTAVDNDELLFTKENVGAIVQRRVSVVKPEPLSQCQPDSKFWKTLRTQEEEEEDVDAGDGVGPTEPADFATGPRTLTYEDYYSEIRMRYVMGVQIMVELQIKTLVEKFNVCPIIVGMIEPIWLRFLAETKLFSDDWADEVIYNSESHVQGEAEGVGARAKHKYEPHNLLGKRSVMIWYQSVSKTVPLSYSLVISFLVCHLAREPILSTDIIKWALEGKLPYFAAFVEIEKQIGPPTNACPLSSSRMFRPVHAISIQKLESLAASLAYSIGLELPPVNFYAIASRYLKQLSLPVETILPHACRIYEWSMPPELWLSTNEFRLPTRAYVLSVLIVSIRILYNIHGFGKWETSLSCATKKKNQKKTKVLANADKEKVNVSNTAELSDSCSRQSDVDDPAAESYNNLPEQPQLDATKILLVLQSKYKELIDTSDHAKDLETYLEYCKDVVFAGAELSFEDIQEYQIIEDLWNFYQKKEDRKPSESPSSSPASPYKRPRKPKDYNAQITHDSKESHKEREIWRMVSSMEENNFCYIPPRTKVKRHDYLHYMRKKGTGAYVYAAHVDYYILLRSCARLAQLDVRYMHVAVLCFERRLAWLEKNIQHCLKQMPSSEACQLCHDDEVVQNVPNDDFMDMDFSVMNL